MLGDEVLDGGHHAVARPALGERVVHLLVEAAALEQIGAPSAATQPQPPLRPWLAVPLGDLLGGVVEVAAAVGPTDVVKEADRQRRAASRAVAASILSSLKTVYQLWSPSISAASTGGNSGSTLWLIAVEVVAAWEPPLVLGRIELRHRVDHVDLGLRPEQVEQLHRRLAPEGADLDHPLGAGGAEDGRDDLVPERIHQPLLAGDPGTLGDQPAGELVELEVVRVVLEDAVAEAGLTSFGGCCSAKRGRERVQPNRRRELGAELLELLLDADDVDVANRSLASSSWCGRTRRGSGRPRSSPPG